MKDTEVHYDAASANHETIGNATNTAAVGSPTEDDTRRLRNSEREKSGSEKSRLRAAIPNGSRPVGQ